MLFAFMRYSIHSLYLPLLTSTFLFICTGYAWSLNVRMRTPIQLVVLFTLFSQVYTQNRQTFIGFLRSRVYSQAACSTTSSQTTTYIEQK